MGNRHRKYGRNGKQAHIPGQEQAGQPPVDHTRVVVNVLEQDGIPTLSIEGGKDRAHRQLILFRALEAESRRTMVFLQQMNELMEEDPDVKAKVEAFLQRKDEEAAAARKAAELQLVKATAQDVAAVEETRVRG